jgi:hypothetical protein
MELKKGNLIFKKSLLVDLIYVVESQQGERVTARKIDAPHTQKEALLLSDVVKLADEQERLLPLNVAEAIEKQREVVFAPPKMGKKKGVASDRMLKKMLKELPKEGIEEILNLLGKVEKEGGEKNGEELLGE